MGGNRSDAQCSVCGKPSTGRYEGLPVCEDCYRVEKLRKWLDNISREPESIEPEVDP